MRKVGHDAVCGVSRAQAGRRLAAVESNHSAQLSQAATRVSKISSSLARARPPRGIKRIAPSWPCVQRPTAHSCPTPSP